MTELEPEAAFLCCVSADPFLLDRTDLEARDFGIVVNQILFEGLRNLHDSGKPAGDMLLLETEIGDALTEQEKLAFRLSMLSDFGYINLTHGEHYAEIIAEQSDRRTFTEALNRAAKVGLSGKLAVDEATAVLEAGISHRRKKVVDIRQAVAEVWQQAEDYQTNPLKPGEVRDLDTGWPDLNRCTGGWYVGLHIVMAVPHVGKTWFALHTAAHAASLGKRVLFFPLEMTREIMVARLCTAHARVSRFDYKAGRMTRQQHGKFGDRAGQIADWDLIIDDRASNLAQVMTAIRRAHRKAPLDLVVIDPLGLLAREKSANRNVQLGTVTAEFKILAREIKAPILVPHHVSDKEINRRDDKRPRAADPYESGHIHQNADILLGLYRDDMYNSDPRTKNVMEVLLLKDREGGATGGRICLTCDRFGNLHSMERGEQQPGWRGGQ